jgi:hypothetical protein
MIVLGSVNDVRAIGASNLANQSMTGVPEMNDSADLGQIIAHQGDLIMSLDDVVGIGEGLCDGDPCVRVFLSRENSASIAQIEEILAGIPFAIEISGEFIATPQ